MSTSRVMKFITGMSELVLAIPIFGGLLIIGWSYLPLTIMFLLHLITLVLSLFQRKSFVGSVIGLTTSVVGWIPFVGWVMHLTTAIVLLIEAVIPEARQYDDDVIDIDLADEQSKKT